MKFSYEWLQSYFNKPLPKPEELAEILTMHSFETEVDGDILDIDVEPNRAPDCYSHLGIAREVSTLLSESMSEVEPHSGGSTSEKLKTADFVKLDVQEPELCPRYMALLVKGVKVKESPDWLKERLASIRQKSINNIVDIANYVMLETGQPLHVFDLEKLGSTSPKATKGKPRIIVRKAKEGEKIETLDGKEVILTKDMLVIADEQDALAIAGIKGGKKAEITKDTKDIIIEAAIFDPASIRTTSKDVKIQTDASMRFEHGVSMFLPEQAILRTAQLTQELAGGEIANTATDSCQSKPIQSKVLFETKDVSKILGKEISPKEIEDILTRLRFEIEKKGDSFTTTSPKERLDINIKEDVVEEIGRIYGYENIKSKVPGATKILPERNEEFFYTNYIRGILAGLGFSEVYNYSFWKTGRTEVANPISKDKAYLRDNLLPALRLNVVENFKNFDEVRLFEVGKVFDSEKEKVKIGLIIDHKKDKTDIKAELRGVADSLFLKEVGIKNNAFEIGLDLVIDAIKENGIEVPEFNFETKDVEYKPFSVYPAIIRDISLFVPTEVGIEEVMSIIENTAGELLIDTDLFDEFVPGPASPEASQGKKSLAFRLIFQSYQKTLTDKEVGEIINKIMSALDAQELWQVRRK